MKQFCSQCGTHLEAGTLTCQACNTSLRAVSPSSLQTACSKCGTVPAPSALYCRKCGEQLGGTADRPGSNDDVLLQPQTLIKRKGRRDTCRRPLSALRRTLSAMFHRGIPIAIISAIALFFVAFFVAVIAYVLWPVTIAGINFGDVYEGFH